MGGNRSGKTTGGTAESLFFALGTHPFFKIKTPNKGVVIGQDFENHVKNILEPKFNEWAPKGSIIKEERNQNGAWRKIWLNCGSVIDFLSHDQDLKVFEGSDYDWAWFDEPPPRNIFKAVWRGLTDRGGYCWVTGTLITEPWIAQTIKKPDKNMWFVFADSYDNAKNIGQGDENLGKQRLLEFENELDPDEREARISGKSLQLQGQVFKDWDRSIHLISPFPWPSNWPVIETIDPHAQKPWAVAWIGITPSGRKILLRSGLYEGVLETIADQILAERMEIEIEHDFKINITRCIIDNHASTPMWSKSNTDPTAKRLSVRQELENMIGPSNGGPRIEVAPKNVQHKITLTKRWLKVDEDKDTNFYVFDIAENERFIFEIENYVWDRKRGRESGLKDQPLKKDDDILDAIMQVAITVEPKQQQGGSRPQPVRYASRY